MQPYAIIVRYTLTIRLGGVVFQLQYYTVSTVLQY